MSKDRQLNYPTSFNPRHQPQNTLSPRSHFQKRGKSPRLKKLLPKLSELATNISQKDCGAVFSAA